MDLPTLTVLLVIAAGPILAIWCSVALTLRGIREGGFVRRWPILSAFLLYLVFLVCSILIGAAIVDKIDPIGAFLLVYSYPFLYGGGLILSLILVHVRGRKIES